MMENKLKEIARSVAPLDEAAMEAARKRQAQLAKPPGSLGRLEELSIQLAGITGKVHNTVEKKHLLVFAADNGVVEEGVASSPQSVTLMQTVNLTRAKTGASVLAKHFGAGITVCDVGVNANIRDTAVLNRKIAYGTKNMAKEPAMTREQAVKSIEVGIGMVEMLKEKGYQFYLDSPTNQIFVVVENAKYAELSKQMKVSFIEKADDNHTVIRFCTSWATKTEVVEELIRDIEAC